MARTKQQSLEAEQALNGIISEEAERASRQGSMLVIDGGLESTTMKLRSFIERIERLREDARALSEDMSIVKQEAKDEGFDVKVIMAVVKIRESDDPKYDLEQLALYCRRAGIEWPS